MKKRTALVLGASGLVGQEVVQELLHSSHYDSVTVLVRKPLVYKHEKLQQQIINFDTLAQYESFFHVDDVYSCLGTTIKKAKTKENFMKVDYEYTLQAAKLAEKQGAQNFLVISSMGASQQSKFFYSQVKGKMEDDVKQLSIPGIHIFRPSLLLGEREEFRFGEKFAEQVARIFPFVFKGPFRKYAPITTKQVAQGMYKVALDGGTGIHIYESHAIGK